MRSFRPALPLLVTLALTLAGCLDANTRESSGGGQPTGGGDPAPGGSGQAQAHELRTLATGEASGYTEPARMVVSTDEEWRQVWQRHAPGEPLPAVDFSRERVVAVFLGSNAPPCSHVRVTNATTTGGETRVEVTTYQQEDCAAVVTQPHHIVAVSTLAASVAYQDRTVHGAPPGA